MDPKEGTTTLEAQTSGAAQVVPPAPVDPLQTNFPIAALEKRLDVIKHLSASCSAKQLQQKEDKNIWRVIFESKNGGSPQFSGTEMFKKEGHSVMKVLKISSLSDQKERDRCLEFSLPKIRSLDRKERKFPVQITKNGKTHDYNALIVPKTFYRVVLTGPGINSKSPMITLLQKDAWITSTSAPTAEDLKKETKISMTCIFPTNKPGVPPQLLLNSFATPEMSKAGIYARWTVPNICTNCGNAGHSEDKCAFEQNSEEAAWMRKQTSEHAKYHQKQLTFIEKRAAYRVSKALSPVSPSNLPPSPTPAPGPQFAPHSSRNSHLSPQSDLQKNSSQKAVTDQKLNSTSKSTPSPVPPPSSTSNSSPATSQKSPAETTEKNPMENSSDNPKSTPTQGPTSQGHSSQGAKQKSSDADTSGVAVGKNLLKTTQNNSNQHTSSSPSSIPSPVPHSNSSPNPPTSSGGPPGDRNL
jgi:hypothetical protein